MYKLKQFWWKNTTICKTTQRNFFSNLHERIFVGLFFSISNGTHLQKVKRYGIGERRERCYYIINIHLEFFYINDYTANIYSNYPFLLGFQLLLKWRFVVSFSLLSTAPPTAIPLSRTLFDISIFLHIFYCFAFLQHFPYIGFYYYFYWCFCVN